MIDLTWFDACVFISGWMLGVATSMFFRESKSEVPSTVIKELPFEPYAVDRCESYMLGQGGSYDKEEEI